MIVDSVPILGVPIHSVDMDGAVERIFDMVDVGRRTGRAHQVATVNTDFLVNAHRDPEVHRILQHADLAIADGMPVVWASRLMGAELPERVAGADLVPALVEAAATRSVRIMLFGGAADSAQRAAELLRNRHDGADVVSATTIVGSDGSIEPDAFRQLRDASPDILCVGLGHPKQERFIVSHAAALGVSVSIGTGATFEFLCGDIDRAPEWMQRTGFEWLHRMVRDPVRLVRRYGTDARVFAPALATQLRALRRGPRQAERPTAIPAASVGATPDTIDVSGIEQISAPTAITLSSHATLARRLGRSIRLDNVSSSLGAQLRRLKIDALFDGAHPSSTHSKVFPS